MARISGIEMNDNWRLAYALTKLRGIGWARSEKIMAELHMDTKTRVSQLTNEDLSKISQQLEAYLVEGDLARDVREHIQRLKTIGAYRGIRHARNLPVRGQRTRSNARTKRGARKTIGAFKKEELTKQAPPATK